MWYDPARHGAVEQIGAEMIDLVLNGVRDRKPATRRGKNKNS
jgi:hypothetical protein